MELEYFLIYARQSVGKARSIAEQITDAQARARDIGCAVLGTYKDTTSASEHRTREREDWPKVTAHLRRCDPATTALWLWEPSRADRDTATGMRFLHDCRGLGVRIYVETSERIYDLANDDDMGALEQAILDAAKETRKLRKRVGRAQKANIKDGKPLGRPPHGYRSTYDPSTGQLTGRVVDSERAGHVRELFRRLWHGEGLTVIAKDWRRRDIRTAGGKYFSPTHLRQLARNPAYIGLRVHTPRGSSLMRRSLADAVEATWPPIVDRETWYAVKAILDDPARVTSRSTAARHLLSINRGVTCGVCGSYLDVVASPALSRIPYYRCHARQHVFVKQAELDKLAIRMITGFLGAPENFSLFAPQPGPELAEVRAELAEVRAKRAALAAEVTRHGKSPGWAFQADEQYETRIKALAEREIKLMIPSSVAWLIEAGGNAAAAWGAATVPAQREVAKVLLAPGFAGAIKVNRARKGIPTPLDQRIELIIEDQSSPEACAQVNITVAVA